VSKAAVTSAIAERRRPEKPSRLIDITAANLGAFVRAPDGSGKEPGDLAAQIDLIAILNEPARQAWMVETTRYSADETTVRDAATPVRT
jgi:hypothetical protein